MIVKIAKARTIPSTVQTITYEVNGSTTQLEWEPITDANLSHYQIRHAIETSSAIWSDATTAVAKVSRPANSVSVPARAGTYMIKAYSKGGKPSSNWASVVVPAADLNGGYSQTLTRAEQTAFSGNKIGLTVASNKIYTTGGNTALINRYDFSNYIETHDNAVKLANVRIDAAVDRKDLTDGTVDTLPNLFDDLPTGFIYDENSGFDYVHVKNHHNDCNLIFEVSTTDDNPASSPTWSAYKPFRAGQFSGRAFRFSVYFRSSATGFSPEVSTLTAYVEY